FVITTEVCRRYLASGWPAGLDDAIEAAVARLGEAMGLRLGEGAAPLLASVRSGAPVSMPGMMDTLLNVGITPAIATSMARATGDESVAADCWLRFCTIDADVVLGLPKDRVGAVAVHEDTAGSRMAAAA